MKKKFLLSGMILLVGFFFPAVNDNSLKACCKNAGAGCQIKKSNAKIPVNEMDGDDGSLNMFMNPFQKL
ncbi:MAG: hypothetical protein IPP96_14175 [Chitinophagaceae bacterium]|nr:hypothetical protein [Chitinophagaceae bacterium]